MENKKGDRSMSNKLIKKKKEEERIPPLPAGGAAIPFIYGVLIAAALAINIVDRGVLAFGNIERYHAVFYILGAVFCVLGAVLWIGAVFVSKISMNVRNNRLVTDGVYAWVRNPTYTGAAFIATGALLFKHNAVLLILPFVFWIYMTVLVRRTEEKWLLERYGTEYEEYCARTNRCIPWFPKKGKERTTEGIAGKAGT